MTKDLVHPHLPDFEPVGPGRHPDHRPVLDLPGQQFPRDRVDQVFLDHAFERARAIDRVVAAVGDPGEGPVVEGQGQAAVGEEFFEARQLDADDSGHLVAAEAAEQDDLVDAVEEFGAEMGADRVHDHGAHGVDGFALGLLRQEFRAEV